MYFLCFLQGELDPSPRLARLKGDARMLGAPTWISPHGWWHRWARRVVVVIVVVVHMTEVGMGVVAVQDVVNVVVLGVAAAGFAHEHVARVGWRHGLLVLHVRQWVTCISMYIHRACLGWRHGCHGAVHARWHAPLDACVKGLPRPYEMRQTRPIRRSRWKRVRSCV